MFDANCHLHFDSLWVEWQKHWQAAQAAGVQGAVVSASNLDPPALDRLSTLADHGFVIALGWHPLEPFPDNAIDQLVRQLQLFPHSCVGEIGLDFRRDKSMHCFEAQLEVAQDLGRSVIVHAVGAGALDQAYECVRTYDLNGWVHAFSGSVEQAQRWVDLGFGLSVGGPLLNAQSNRLRRWVEAVPLSALMVESDAPDLPPAGLPRSTPALVADVVEAVAKVRNESVEQVAQQTRANALSRLGLAAVPRVRL